MSEACREGESGRDGRERSAERWREKGVNAAFLRGPTARFDLGQVPSRWGGNSFVRPRIVDHRDAALTPGRLEQVESASK